MYLVVNWVNSIAFLLFISLLWIYKLNFILLSINFLNWLLYTDTLITTKPAWRMGCNMFFRQTFSYYLSLLMHYSWASIYRRFIFGDKQLYCCIKSSIHYIRTKMYTGHLFFDWSLSGFHSDLFGNIHWIFLFDLFNFYCYFSIVFRT